MRSTTFLNGLGGKMLSYENDCVDCGLPCLHSSCRYWRVPHFYCDKCGDETDKLYEYDGQELCEECVLSVLPVVRTEED